MKRICKATMLSLMFFFVLVTFSWAGTYTFIPPDPDMSDLEHGHYYTWGIDWGVPAGEVIVGANLFFDDIRNHNSSENVLYVHLFDTAAVGIDPGIDNNTTDDFAGQGVKLFEWSNLSSTATDLTYNFTPTNLVTLASYLEDGNFGLGFDPDCHFYNNGITFTVETSAVPIPGAIWLLGSGLIGLLIRRKRRVN